MAQAFTPRICATGADTGVVLGSISSIVPGSLIGGVFVCPPAPPFVEVVPPVITPPTIAIIEPPFCVIMGKCDERPDPCSQPCRFFFATDTSVMWYDTCTKINPTGKWIRLDDAVVRTVEKKEDLPETPMCDEDEECEMLQTKFVYVAEEKTMYFSDCTADEWVPVGSCVSTEGTIEDRPEPGPEWSCFFYYDYENEVLYYNDVTNEEWIPLNGGIFDPETAVQIGECADSTSMDEEPDAPTDCEELAWDINNQPEDSTGVIVTMLTRIVYKTSADGGSEILYGYCRSFGFDTSGRLVAISEECERTIIDTPEPCTGSSSSSLPGI